MKHLLFVVVVVVVVDDNKSKDILPYFRGIRNKKEEVSINTSYIFTTII